MGTLHIKAQGGVALASETQKVILTTAPNRIRKWSPTLLLTGRYPGCLRRSDGMRNFLDSMAVDRKDRLSACMDYKDEQWCRRRRRSRLSQTFPPTLILRHHRRRVSVDSSSIDMHIELTDYLKDFTIPLPAFIFRQYIAPKPHNPLPLPPTPWHILPTFPFLSVDNFQLLESSLEIIS